MSSVTTTFLSVPSFRSRLARLVSFPRGRPYLVTPFDVVVESGPPETVKEGALSGIDPLVRGCRAQRE